MITEFWIEKIGGTSIDNATVQDTESVIREIIKTDQGIDTFWVGHKDKEYVLEIHKSLDLFLIFGENQDKRLQIKLKNWEQVRDFLRHYFRSDFLRIKDEIELRLSSNRLISNR